MSIKELLDVLIYVGFVIIFLAFMGKVLLGEITVKDFTAVITALITVITRTKKEGSSVSENKSEDKTQEETKIRKRK